MQAHRRRGSEWENASGSIVNTGRQCSGWSFRAPTSRCESGSRRRISRNSSAGRARSGGRCSPPGTHIPGWGRRKRTARGSTGSWKLTDLTPDPSAVTGIELLAGDTAVTASWALVAEQAQDDGVLVSVLLPSPVVVDPVNVAVTEDPALGLG